MTFRDNGGGGGNLCLFPIESNNLIIKCIIVFFIFVYSSSSVQVFTSICSRKSDKNISFPSCRIRWIPSLLLLLNPCSIFPLSLKGLLNPFPSVVIISCHNSNFKRVLVPLYIFTYLIMLSFTLLLAHGN